MTPELAAQIIANHPNNRERIELFIHFEQFFWPTPDHRKQEMFARMCGWQVVDGSSIERITE